MPECKSVTIIDTTINIVEYLGKRVVTLDMIDKLHHRPEGTAKRNFTSNKDRFEDGKHFYLIDYSKKNEFRTFGIDVPARGITVITERGYSMLVKSFNDDFAWDVQEQLSDSYFDTGQQMSTAEFILHQAQIAVDQERKIKAIEVRQDATDRHIIETNAKVKVKVAEEKADSAFKSAQAALKHKFGNADYFTIMAYSSIHSGSLDISEAKLKGANAARISRQNDKPIIKVPDERFGKVNSYYVSVLEKVFARLR